MNFSKTNEDGIPMWRLIHKGKKTITRRPPRCKNCRKKEWEHSEGGHCKREGLGEHGLSLQKYEPDLSAWKVGSWRSICPGRGKAAICENCGKMKEEHYRFIDWYCDANLQRVYSPFKLKIKSVMMEVEWIKMMLKEQKECAEACEGEDKTAAYLGEIQRQEEANSEGFRTWEGLQEALYGKGGYPKGAKMARIEFVRVD